MAVGVYGVWGGSAPALADDYFNVICRGVESDLHYHGLLTGQAVVVGQRHCTVQQMHAHLQ